MKTLSSTEEYYSNRCSTPTWDSLCTPMTKRDTMNYYLESIATLRLAVAMGKSNKAIARTASKLAKKHPGTDVALILKNITSRATVAKLANNMVAKYAEAGIDWRDLS